MEIIKLDTEEKILKRIESIAYMIGDDYVNDNKITNYMQQIIDCINLLKDKLK